MATRCNGSGGATPSRISRTLTQCLAALPKKRPAAPGDDMLASEVIERLNRAFEEESKGRRDGFEVLKAQAKHERAELESYITKTKGR